MTMKDHVQYVIFISAAYILSEKSKIISFTTYLEILIFRYYGSFWKNGEP